MLGCVWYYSLLDINKSYIIKTVGHGVAARRSERYTMTIHKMRGCPELSVTFQWDRHSVPHIALVHFVGADALKDRAGLLLLLTVTSRPRLSVPWRATGLPPHSGTSVEPLDGIDVIN